MRKPSDPAARYLRAQDAAALAAAAEQRKRQKQQALRFGMRLRWAREIASVTPTQLGAATGVDTSLIRHIELGDRLPSLHLLVGLCEVLQITPNYLLYGEVETLPRALANTLVALHPELARPAPRPRGLGKRGKAVPAPFAAATKLGIASS